MLCSGLDTRLHVYDKRSSVLYLHQNRLRQQPASLRGFMIFGAGQNPRAHSAGPCCYTPPG